MTTETTVTAISLKDIKVWHDANRKECRIYVHTLDGREGCRYITGNRYHAPKSVDGQLTDEEWKEARRLAYDGTSWQTMYFTPAPWEKNNSRRERCPDCGGYDCGGGNCNSNRF